MFTYFTPDMTVAEIKKEYRKWAMILHPDRRGGDLAQMQALNAQYEKALKAADGKVSKGSDGKDHTYRYNEAVEAEIMAFIERLLASKLLDTANLQADLIGTWVWITGDTYPHRAALKELGAKYHGKRQCWFFNVEDGRTWYSKKGLESLAAEYGISHIGKDEQPGSRGKASRRQIAA